MTEDSILIECIDYKLSTGRNAVYLRLRDRYERVRHWRVEDEAGTCLVSFDEDLFLEARAAASRLVMRLAEADVARAEAAAKVAEIMSEFAVSDKLQRPKHITRDSLANA